MKYRNINYLIIGITFAVAAFASCKKFNDINVDPLAASAGQVQLEYFINNSIIGAQQDPHIAERAFVLYWKTAGRHQLSGGLSSGGSNDGWSSDYWAYASNWLNPVNSAIEVGETQIAEGTNRLYTSNLIQVARIWRAYLMSELSDNFGPIAIDAFKGVNPEYASVKDVYYFLLEELKDASAKMDLAVESPATLNKDKVAFSYKYNWAKWQKYANSMRMRLAMRIAEVDPAKAKQEFESAVQGSNVILTASETFDVQEQPGWDALTGVMSREWNIQYLSATLNNIYTNLGGIPSEDQLPADLQHAVKPADYIGLKYPQMYTDKTNDPTVGYWLDGLPNVMDPRAYKAFIIPGWFSNLNFSYYPSWTNDAKTTVRKVKFSATDSINIDATHTWNTTTSGDWGAKGAINTLRGYPGTTPTLALNFRNSTSKRIFFAPWETYFLIAEAAVKGWTVPLSGQAAYEAGIKASFEYWGVTAHLASYLASTTYNRVGTSVSWTHTTEPGSAHTMKYKDGKTGVEGTIDIKYPVNNLYKNGTVKNDLLTKIITQKYIAQVPWLPLEAWSDQRRLGLPFFENPAIENPLPGLPGLTSSNFMTSNIKFFPQRLKYPSSLESGSPKGYQNAVDKLGGTDGPLTPLWWAKQQ